MRGVWVAIVVGVVGCTSTPKREMRQPQAEEFVTPTDNLKEVPDLTRDQPLLVPKQNTPGLNTGQTPGVGGPMGPGGSARR